MFDWFINFLRNAAEIKEKTSQPELESSKAPTPESVPLPEPIKPKEKIDLMIETILKHEGGYVNHPNDKGGPTNFGITITTLGNWRKAPVTINDVKNLTEAEAKNIYKSEYLIKPKINILPLAIQEQMFDMSINHGPGRSIKILQKTLNQLEMPTGVDGGVGPQTVKNAMVALDKFGEKTLNNCLVDCRIDFYNEIVSNNPTQKVFLKGWLSRAESFRK